MPQEVTLGQMLYWHYAQTHDDYNVIVDAWEELDEANQTIWNTLARRIGYVPDDAVKSHFGVK